MQRSSAKHVIFLVATTGRIVGSVIGGWDGWRGNIYRLAVAPEARRHRVAAALVREVSERLGREKGARRITALVEKAHPDAVGFWDSMASEGYAFDPRIVQVCEDGYEAEPKLVTYPKCLRTISDN